MSDTESNLDPQAEPTVAELTIAKVDKQDVRRTDAMTAAQARVIEVTDALAPAYAKASQLELTDQEIAALQEPFPDSAVEVRPHDGLIYIPHIHISNRLNRVLNPGKWATICRRHWMSDNVMYGEYVLVIRGCYVGESIGGHPYVPSNKKTNYSDALESTRAEALRRICGKTLGVGSQVWEPEYSRTWVSRYAYQHKGMWEKKPIPGTNQPQDASNAPPPAANPPRQSTSGSPQAAAGQSLGPDSSVPVPGVAAGRTALNATRTHQEPAPAKPAAQPVKRAPASQPAAAQGHSCPKCRGTATKESQDLHNVRWCQRCGWQWETAKGTYYEEHEWAKVICTIPPKGCPIEEYRKNPQTLGQIARLENSRWFGLIMNNTEAQQAKGWTSPTSGKHFPATVAQLAFGRACEQAAAYVEEQKRFKEQEQREEPSQDDVPF